MGQSIYFDSVFNNLISEIRDCNIPKYSKNISRISRKNLYEPLSFLVKYLSNIQCEELQSICEEFNEKKIRIRSSLSRETVVDHDNKKRTIKLKGFRKTEEDKRKIAYLLGAIFSKYVPREVHASFTKVDENVQIPFSLDSNEVDYEMFFGFLFEYLYLVQNQKNHELMSIGIIANTSKVEDDAFEIFIKKYLNIFFNSANEYARRKVEYARKINELSDKANLFDCQDAATELDSQDDERVDSSLRTKLIAFNKVLELIHMGLSNKGCVYKPFLSQCFEQREIENSEETPNNYKYLSKAYEKYKTLVEKPSENL